MRIMICACGFDFGGPMFRVPRAGPSELGQLSSPRVGVVSNVAAITAGARLAARAPARSDGCSATPGPRMIPRGPRQRARRSVARRGPQSRGSWRAWRSSRRGSHPGVGLDLTHSASGPVAGFAGGVFANACSARLGERGCGGPSSPAGRLTRTRRPGGARSRRAGRSLNEHVCVHLMGAVSVTPSSFRGRARSPGLAEASQRSAGPTPRFWNLVSRLGASPPDLAMCCHFVARGPSPQCCDLGRDSAALGRPREADEKAIVDKTKLLEEAVPQRSLRAPGLNRHAKCANR